LIDINAVAISGPNSFFEKRREIVLFRIEKCNFMHCMWTEFGHSVRISSSQLLPSDESG